MHATSAAQAASAINLSVPDLEEVRPGTWALPLAMPDSPLGFMLCYLLTDAAGGAHVVDPGWATEENWDRLVNGVQRIDRTISDVRSIAVTHLHRDHVGLAARLRDESGATVAMGAVEHAGMLALAGPSDPASAKRDVERWGVPAARQAELLEVAFPSHVRDPLTVDRMLGDGDTLDVPGRVVRAILTPGHTSGHMCFVEEESGLLLTGDHVLPTVNPGLGLGGPSVSNPVDDYLDSLDVLAAFDDFEVLPGHGYRFIGLGVRRAELGRHVRRRTEGVAAALEDAPDATVWHIAERLEWTAGWDNLRGAMLRSALMQTAMHAHRVTSASG